MVFTMTYKSGIYQIKNKITEDIYIGSSYRIEKRFIQHKSDLIKNKHGNPYLQNAVNKYGLDNFVFEIILECDRKELIQKEQWCLDTLLPNYNIRKIAESNLGIKWTEEQKLNKSKIHTGRPSAKKGKKTGKPAWNRGIPMPEETKNIFRKKFKGKRFSPRTELKPGHNLNPTTQVKCLETNIIFNSIKEAAIFAGKESYSANISACCRGKQKTAYGYHWEYVNERRSRSSRS